MGSLDSYGLLAWALFGWTLVWFALSVCIARNDIADIAWGLGFIFLAWLSFFIGGRPNHALPVNVVVTIWGLRLAGHIYSRNRGKPEDFRYAQWRKQWRHFYTRSFLQVFLLQNAFLYIIAWPVILVNLAESVPFHWAHFVGVVTWLVGFLFETVGDYQLTKFKQNPANRGRIITIGLWRYTRHPNYFGEAVQWWGVYLMATAVPGGWITFASPLLITYLLRYVSGVPMLERKYENHPEFQLYKVKTSAFIPMPPKV